MLGHASAAMTLDVYADLFDDDLDAVAAALNVRLSQLETNIPLFKNLKEYVEKRSPCPAFDFVYL
jgi:hypothetical protein